MNTKELAINAIRDALVDAYAYGSDTKLSNIANHIYNSLESAGLQIKEQDDISKFLDDNKELMEDIAEIENRERESPIKPSEPFIILNSLALDELLVSAYNWLLKNERSPSNESNRHKAAEDLITTLLSEKK